MSAQALRDGGPLAAECLPEALVEAAIAWAVRLDYNTPSPGERRAFEAWLQADPRHGLAWQRVHALKGFEGALGGLPASLAGQTLRAVQRQRAHRGGTRRRVLKALSLGGVVVAAGSLARDYAPWQRWVGDASTAVGEQRSLSLDDGSVVMLNTDSAFSADLRGLHRRLVLHRGEIRVTTGTDTGQPVRRPFWVDTPAGRLEALGTRFVVRLYEGGARARVEVQAGAVALMPAVGGARDVMQAGERRWLTRTGTAPAEALGFEADAWTDGVIAGTGIRLADLLDELARYRPGRVDCDPQVAERRVSGVFHVRQTDQVLAFLAQTQGLSVRYLTRFWVRVGPLPVA